MVELPAFVRLVVLFIVSLIVVEVVWQLKANDVILSFGLCDQCAIKMIPHWSHPLGCCL
jgi:hypothetical protein